MTPKKGRIQRMLLFLGAGCAALGATAVMLSPGTPRPVVDTSGVVVPGSLAEKAFIEINGAKQGIFIKTRSAELPVLLFLHGGIPDYFLTARHPTGLEDIFTVVWWEQRGSGLSHAAADASTPVTVDLLVNDAIALTEHLRSRFGQEKIYLMGRSGGSFLGLQVVDRAPQLYHAYIGVGQITDQLESEQLAYEYMLARFRESGDTRWVRRLEATTVEHGTSPEYLRIRDAAMHTLGVGTMREMRSIVTGLFVPSLLFPEYTVREKWHLWAAKARNGVSSIWDAVVSTDLRQTVPEVQVPVYFFHGLHDYTCSYSLARAYTAELRAPVKGFYTFHHSAHSPHFEEPDRVREIIRRDVLQGTVVLAHAPQQSASRLRHFRGSGGTALVTDTDPK
jgi:pimeloyl-ACP methyl ester carboxylesterase